MCADFLCTHESNSRDMELCAEINTASVLALIAVSYPEAELHRGVLHPSSCSSCPSIVVLVIKILIKNPRKPKCLLLNFLIASSPMSNHLGGWFLFIHFVDGFFFFIILICTTETQSIADPQPWLSSWARQCVWVWLHCSQFGVKFIQKCTKGSVGAWSSQPGAPNGHHPIAAKRN